MQNDPEKISSNYNELVGDPTSTIPQLDGTYRIQLDQYQDEVSAKEIVRVGNELVNNKIDEILGDDNKLTDKDTAKPTVSFSHIENPLNTLGYFSPKNNLIVIHTKLASKPIDQLKVFIHEYLHFMSHNARDSEERLSSDSPLAQRNNVGFSRSFGLDISQDNEGKRISNYFLSFNEAVTEQLAIDILPGIIETYEEYRGLLNQVIIDATEAGMGTYDENRTFKAWTKDQCKNYIYECYLKGDLNGFTNFLKTVYQKYDISESEFGLMTSKDDLPTEVYRKLTSPDGTPPTIKQVMEQIRKQLNAKTQDDYITDVDLPDPGDGGGGAQQVHRTAYFRHINENEIKYAYTKSFDDIDFDIDTAGYIIFKGELASAILDSIKLELEILVERGFNVDDISAHIDKLLFDKKMVSMLSDGFEDFYLYKHAILDEISDRI